MVRVNADEYYLVQPAETPCTGYDDGQTDDKMCCRLLRPVYAFTLAGLLCSAVHMMVYSILSISLITVAQEFQLTWAQRGFILSAFSLTYSIFQIPGGFFVMKYGPYIGPMFASCGSCLALIVIPIAVHIFGAGDKGAIVAIFYCNMLFLGFLGAGYNPAFHDIIAHKVPISSRSFVHNLVYSGQQLGAVVATVGVAASIGAFGWRVTYVIAGSICFFVGITWRLLVNRQMPNVDNSGPHENQATEDGEPATVVFTTYEKWRTVLTSPAFLVICLNHFGSVWISRVAMNWGPTFLHTREGIEFSDLGYLAALPRLLGFFVVSGSGSLTLYLIQARHWTVASVRKFMQAIGMGLPALLLIWMNYETSTFLVIALLLSSSALTGLTFGGYHCNHIDIAPDPNMASLMYSITNTIGQLPGVIEPLIDSSILEFHSKLDPSTHTAANPSQAAWSTIWFIIVAVSAFCIFFWLLFCRGVPIVLVKRRG